MPFTLQNATEELKRLEAAFDHVRQSLFTRLHDIVREQIFVSGGGPALAAEAAVVPEKAPSLAENGQNGNRNGSKQPSDPAAQAGLEKRTQAKTGH